MKWYFRDTSYNSWPIVWRHPQQLCLWSRRGFASPQSALSSSHLTSYLIGSLLNYASELVVNWTEIMAVRRPQIWHEKCMVVGFTQLCVCKTSLQALQTTIAVYDTHYSGMGKTNLSQHLACGIVGLWPAFLLSKLLYHSHIFFNMCALMDCHCYVSSQCFMFFTGLLRNKRQKLKVYNDV